MQKYSKQIIISLLIFCSQSMKAAEYNCIQTVMLNAEIGIACYAAAKYGLICYRAALDSFVERYYCEGQEKQFSAAERKLKKNMKNQRPASPKMRRDSSHGMELRSAVRRSSISSSKKSK